ncbi:uncharacterized protein N7469_004742 [Penicillium citrinum]|uniref:Uncharacterized protein n=1 Tax=Penicillium citrinum TaxID=5077 RepID=A0A9W9P551_PENCI|nr:uncharacterized protein N7469_004742 [Penicillium citrinum]KAJ5235574.1 hypothetical protein N7469_004742 [Penicillium citrinum]
MYVRTLSTGRRLQALIGWLFLPSLLLKRNGATLIENGNDARSIVASAPKYISPSGRGKDTPDYSDRKDRIIHYKYRDP